LIFLDAFSEYGAPEEVTNTLFLQNLRCCLNQDGLLVGNLWTITGDFIERQNKNGELNNWHIVIVSKPPKAAEHTYEHGNLKIGCVERVPLEVLPDKISIGTLTSPADEMLDLSGPEIARALDFDQNRGKESDDGLPTSIAIRHVRPKTRGLMLIYMPAWVNPENPTKNYGLRGEEVVGFAISFPFSDTAEPIEYLAGPVLMEEE
ncbi:MAG: hypothetical protein QF371_08575, partial [Flavobacteriales bacterium]|nr:hypothetical protein [Flavobacteriales bacterium]